MKVKENINELLRKLEVTKVITKSLIEDKNSSRNVFLASICLESKINEFMKDIYMFINLLDNEEE